MMRFILGYATAQNAAFRCEPNPSDPLLTELLNDYEFDTVVVAKYLKIMVKQALL